VRFLRRWHTVKMGVQMDEYGLKQSKGFLSHFPPVGHRDGLCFQGYEQGLHTAVRQPRTECEIPNI